MALLRDFVGWSTGRSLQGMRRADQFVAGYRRDDREAERTSPERLGLRQQEVTQSFPQESQRGTLRLRQREAVPSSPWRQGPRKWGAVWTSPGRREPRQRGPVRSFHQEQTDVLRLAFHTPCLCGQKYFCGHASVWFY